MRLSTLIVLDRHCGYASVGLIEIYIGMFVDQWGTSNLTRDAPIFRIKFAFPFEH